jgi:hypothetical protein
MKVSKMIGGDLVSLAQRLVELDREAAEVRAKMKQILLNGADPEPRPTSAERSGAKGPPSKAAVMAQAQAADEQVIALLKEKPGTRTGEIARATGAKGTTTSNRLHRLLDKGLIERRDEGWAAISQP